jgi:hypothetical protein
MVKRLYKIWRIQCNVNSQPPSWDKSTVVENGNWAYPLVSVISVLGHRWHRGAVVSMDKDKLERTVEYLNLIADADVSYEVREEIAIDDAG